MDTPTVILVHGAWYGPWAWDKTRRHLGAAGVASAVVDLPSVGERLGGLADDVAAVSAVLNALTGPFVLVGHSYAGLPVTEVAAERDDVGRVLYVCAFVVPTGTTLLDAVGGVTPEWWVFAEDGASILPDDPHDVLFAECCREVADAAANQIRPHSTASVRQPLRAADYGRTPSDYVLCLRDARFPIEAQRACGELADSSITTLDTDHSPMLSAPSELAGILIRACSAVDVEMGRSD